MAALFFKDEVFIIKDDEAKKLAQAIKNVMALHSLNISPSTVAYLQLLGVVGAIYGPRLFALKIKAEIKRAQMKMANSAPQPSSNAPQAGIAFPAPAVTQ